MPETASVICLSRGVTNIVDLAIEILNGAQNEFDFQLVPGSLGLPPPDLGEVYSWGLLGSILAQEKQKIGAKYLFGVLDQSIENNWFSRTLHDQCVCFITTKDWEYLSHLPLHTFVAYEIVENLSEMLVKEIDAHDETRGCITDMCAIKPHISFKIRTADICADCMDMLNEKLKPSVVQALVLMLEAVRREALGRGEPQDRRRGRPSLTEVVDREFPFPVAYCFRSMQAELTYSRKWLKALELYEVIIKYTTFVLLAALGAKKEAPGPASQITNLSRPSVGHWHAACFGLLKYHKASPTSCFVNRFLATLDKKAIQRAYAASERLVPLRNDTRGHGFVEEEARYQLLYEQNLAELQVLLEFVTPLATYPLIKVGEGLRRRHGISTFPAKILMGSHPLFPVQQHETGEQVDTDCLLHDKETGKYLSLYPWIVLDHCRKCYREVVFLYDKLDADSVVIREYPANHTQKRDELFEDVRTRIL
jgi:hypothetical protein